MRWRDTKGYKPNTSADRVFVKLRCGLISKTTWAVNTTRWDHRGDDFDVMAYAVPEEKREEAA